MRLVQDYYKQFKNAIIGNKLSEMEILKQNLATSELLSNNDLFNPLV